MYCEIKGEADSKRQSTGLSVDTQDLSLRVESRDLDSGMAISTDQLDRLVLSTKECEERWSSDHGHTGHDTIGVELMSSPSRGLNLLVRPSSAAGSRTFSGLRLDDQNFGSREPVVWPSTSFSDLPHSITSQTLTWTEERPNCASFLSATLPTTWADLEWQVSRMVNWFVSMPSSSDSQLAFRMLCRRLPSAITTGADGEALSTLSTTDACLPLDVYSPVESSPGQLQSGSFASPAAFSQSSPYCHLPTSQLHHHHPKPLRALHPFDQVSPIHHADQETGIGVIGDHRRSWCSKEISARPSINHEAGVEDGACPAKFQSLGSCDGTATLVSPMALIFQSGKSTAVSGDVQLIKNRLVHERSCDEGPHDFGSSTLNSFTYQAVPTPTPSPTPTLSSTPSSVMSPWVEGTSRSSSGGQEHLSSELFRRADIPPSPPPVQNRKYRCLFNGQMSSAYSQTYQLHQAEYRAEDESKLRALKTCAPRPTNNAAGKPVPWSSPPDALASTSSPSHQNFVISPQLQRDIPRRSLSANSNPISHGGQHHVVGNCRSTSPPIVQSQKSQSEQNYLHRYYSTSSMASLANRQEKGKIPEAIDWALMEDVPGWLRSLRLHKYTDIFWPNDRSRRWNWRDMIELSDDELEKMGVAALGARRKLLKMFSMVKEALEEMSEIRDVRLQCPDMVSAD